MVDAYTDGDDKEAEDYFQKFEKKLRQAMSSAVEFSDRKVNLARMTAGGEMITQAILLDTRNAQHGPGTGFNSRFEASRHWYSVMSMTYLFGVNHDGPTPRVSDAVARTLDASPDQIAKLMETDGDRFVQFADRAIAERWDWRVVNTPPGLELFTSDNPTIWVDYRDTGHFLMLPLSRHQLFVACSRAALRFPQGKRLMMDEADYANLLGVAAVKAHQWLFSPSEIPFKLVEAAKARWETTPRLSSVMHLHEWKGNQHARSSEPGFSFLLAVE